MRQERGGHLRGEKWHGWAPVVVVSFFSFEEKMQCYFFFKSTALEQRGGVVGMSEVVEVNI